MARLLAAALLLVACSSTKDKDKPAPAPVGSAPAAAPIAKDDSPRGLCLRGCTKLVSCAPAVNDAELTTCIETCSAGAPQKAQIEQIEAMTCEQIVQQGVPAAPAPAAAAPATGSRTE